MKSVVGASYADDGTVGFLCFQYETAEELTRRDRALRFALEQGLIDDGVVYGPSRIVRTEVRHVPDGVEHEQVMREMGWRY